MGPPDSDGGRCSATPTPEVSVPATVLDAASVPQPDDPGADLDPVDFDARQAAQLAEAAARRERRRQVRAALAEARRRGLRARHARKLARGGGA